MYLSLQMATSPLQRGLLWVVKDFTLHSALAHLQEWEYLPIQTWREASKSFPYQVLPVGFETSN